MILALISLLGETGHLHVYQAQLVREGASYLALSLASISSIVGIVPSTFSG